MFFMSFHGKQPCVWFYPFYIHIKNALPGQKKSKQKKGVLYNLYIYIYITHILIGKEKKRKKKKKKKKNMCVSTGFRARSS